FTVSGSVTAYGLSTFTYGIISFAINTNGTVTGFTNALGGANNGAGGTNTVQAYITSVAGTLEMYLRGGSDGSAVCTVPIWTNTFSTVNSNICFTVGRNCGFVIRSGSGVAGKIYPLD